MSPAAPRGFTLVDLLIVTAVLGLLAAVLVPSLVNVRGRPYDAASSQCHRAVFEPLSLRTDSRTAGPDVNTRPGVARACAFTGVLRRPARVTRRDRGRVRHAHGRAVVRCLHLAPGGERQPPQLPQHRRPVRTPALLTPREVP